MLDDDYRAGIPFGSQLALQPVQSTLATMVVVAAVTMQLVHINRAEVNDIIEGIISPPEGAVGVAINGIRRNLKSRRAIVPAEIDFLVVACGRQSFCPFPVFW